MLTDLQKNCVCLTSLSWWDSGVSISMPRQGVKQGRWQESRKKPSPKRRSKQLKWTPLQSEKRGNYLYLSFSLCSREKPSPKRRSKQQWNWQLSPVRMWAKGRSRFSASVTVTVITWSPSHASEQNRSVIYIPQLWQSLCHYCWLIQFLKDPLLLSGRPIQATDTHATAADDVHRRKCCCGGQTCLSTCTSKSYNTHTQTHTHTNTHTQRRCQSYPTCSSCVLRIQWYDHFWRLW